MGTLQVQCERVRRRWVLVVVVGVVAAALGGGWALLTGTTYTGAATLTVVSLDRPPAESTVIAQGYVDDLDQPATQNRLRQETGVAPDVALHAHLVGPSPLIDVEATATDPTTAQDAATRIATAQRDDVNRALRADAQQQLPDLQRRAAAADAAGDGTLFGELKNRIEHLESGVDQLEDVDLAAGVATSSAQPLSTAVASGLAGLVAGALIAMAVGRRELLLVSPREVPDRLGRPVLALVGDLDRRWGSLTRLTDTGPTALRGAVAVVAPPGAEASRAWVASALAALHPRGLLVRADAGSDGPPRELAGAPGLTDALDGGIHGAVFRADRARHAPVVVPPGHHRDDLFALLSVPRLRRVLDEASRLAELVVLDAPAPGSPEGEVVAASAGRAVLVVEENVTRCLDARAALETLDRIGVPALGVVLVRRPEGLTPPETLVDRTWWPVRPPEVPAPRREQAGGLLTRR